MRVGGGAAAPRVRGGMTRVGGGSAGPCVRRRGPRRPGHAPPRPRRCGEQLAQSIRLYASPRRMVSGRPPL
eukprot:5073851-Prymnesium_polylepis.1